MGDVHTLGDLIDICLARSEGVLNEDEWKTLLDLRLRVRQRAGFLGEVVVVALAGGTGSGKSSLMNALVRKPVARVSIERPTTSRSFAAVPSSVPGDIEPLIQALGIDETIEVDSLAHTVLVDLPDFDSTFTDHRQVVERVLDIVDAVAWVLDPEKYSDVLVHEAFLKPLSRYGDQMVFVLNKVDQLGGDTRQVVESLREQLIDDGYSDPQIVTTVAAATEDVDLDTSDLERLIERRFDAKRSVIGRLATETAAEANRLWLLMAADADRDEAHAFAMASLVSLGVAGTEVRYRHAPRD